LKSNLLKEILISPFFNKYLISVACEKSLIAEKLNRLVTKRNSTITKTVLKHHWKTVEYMYARGKGCARGAGDLEHDGGCLG